MSYDEGLAERLRALLDERPSVTEKAMFGGVAFLLDGKMFVGIVKDELMARVGPDAYEAALREPHARTMDFTGRPMRGYVFVASEGFAEDAALRRWVERAIEHVRTLPAKPVPDTKVKRAGAKNEVADGKGRASRKRG